MEGSHTPTAMRLHLAPDVASGGVWFPDEPCRTQFADAGPIPGTMLDQLAG